MAGRISMKTLLRGTLALGMVASFIGLGGCASGPTRRERAQLKYFPKAYQLEVSPTTYKVEPPDIITIHAPLAPEVNNVKQQVAPDGTLNLDLLNRVYVAGYSPAQIEKLLTEKLKTYYSDVKVHVDVKDRSQWYYVFGATRNSGPKRFTGRDTLLTALAAAQPTRLGWPDRIYVIEPSTNPQKRHVTVVNLKDMIQRGNTTANVLLEQGDIVYVPYNPLAAIGVGLQNILFPISPALNVASTASYTAAAGGF